MHKFGKICLFFVSKDSNIILCSLWSTHITCQSSRCNSLTVVRTQEIFLYIITLSWPPRDRTNYGCFTIHDSSWPIIINLKNAYVTQILLVYLKTKNESFLLKSFLKWPVYLCVFYRCQFLPILANFCQFLPFYLAQAALPFFA